MDPHHHATANLHGRTSMPAGSSGGVGSYSGYGCAVTAGVRPVVLSSPDLGPVVALSGGAAAATDGMVRRRQWEGWRRCGRGSLPTSTSGIRHRRASNHHLSPSCIIGFSRSSLVCFVFQIQNHVGHLDPHIVYICDLGWEWDFRPYLMLKINVWASFASFLVSVLFLAAQVCLQ